MRRRFQVALYTEHDIEAELIDFLVAHDTRKRQELLRTLLKAGFSAMIKHKSSSAAMLDTLDSDTIALVMQSLMNANAQNNTGMGGQSNSPHQPTRKTNHQHNNESYSQQQNSHNAEQKVNKPVKDAEPKKEFVHSNPEPTENNRGENNKEPENTVDKTSVDDGLLDEDPSIYMSENEGMEWEDDHLGDDLEDEIIDPLSQLMSKMN